VLLASPRLRVASLGGGPAFEIDALREFVHARAPQRPELALYSLDLQPGWKPYAEALGCHFVAPLDVTKASPTDIVSACRGPVDVLVVSYLLIYCTSERTADLFHYLLQKDLVKVLFISERTHDQDIVRLLEARGLAVVPLMPQAGGRDQRQLLVLDPKNRAAVSDPPAELAFPNVPFAKGT